MAERPTLLFYCQHALGLGHLVRSLTLAGATPPFDEQVGRVRLPLGSGVSEIGRAHV